MNRCSKMAYRFLRSDILYVNPTLLYKIFFFGPLSTAESNTSNTQNESMFRHVLHVTVSHVWNLIIAKV